MYQFQVCRWYGWKINNNFQLSIIYLFQASLKAFITEHILPPITMMQTLRNFTKSILVADTCTPSKTLESYAANLKLLLEPITEKLLKFENRLIKPQDFEINTLLSFCTYSKETFEQLKRIFNLHEMVCLNPNQHPPHIYSAYLLSSLVNFHRNSTNAIESNLAMSLFLSSLEIFCNIIDIWWTEGRLDDWQHEFIVERWVLVIEKIVFN